MKKSSNTPAKSNGKSELPCGVSFVRKLKEKDGKSKSLFRLRFMANNRSHTCYESLDTDGVKQKELQAVLTAKMTAFRAAVERGAYEHEITPKSTFEAACAHFLDVNGKLGTLRQSTLIGYETIFNSHLIPRFGALPIEKITPSRVTAFLADLAAESGLKSSSQTSIRTKLSGLFTFYEKQGIIASNPVRKSVKPPKDDTYDFRDVKFLDNTQIADFVSTLGEAQKIADDTKLCIELALRTGMRSGECRGLAWGDIDFTNNTIKVEHNAVRTRDGYALGKVKTKRSRRSLPLDTDLKAILLEHKANQKKRAALLGSHWQNLNLVCADATGGIITASAIDVAFAKIRKLRPDLPPITMHSLRHTYCSLLVYKGYPLTDIAGILGDSVPVCSQVYCHLFDESRSRMANTVSLTLNNLLKPRIESVLFVKP
jgi:integrase